MTNNSAPDDPTAAADDATPVPVPPYEEAPSSTGLVIEEEDEAPDPSEP